MNELLYPHEVVLEVTNHCNLKCRYCHFHGLDVTKKRPLGMMKAEVWQKAIDEIGTWPHSVTVMTHGAGEPLLYSDLFSLLTYARTKPNINLGFMCNGMLLDGAWIDRLIQLPLDWIALSIDGTVALTHDYFRVNADLQRIEANLEALIKAKQNAHSDRPALSFNMVAYPEILGQTKEYVQKWLPHAASVMVSRFRPVGQRHLWDGEAPVPLRPCPLLWKQMIIGYDGRVGLCCEDINLEVSLGQVLENSLADIFNLSPELVSYRRAHQLGRLEDLRLCADCHVWAADIILKQQEFVWEDLKGEKKSSPAFEIYTKATNHE